jgi:hypothetical protein
MMTNQGNRILFHEQREQIVLIPTGSQPFRLHAALLRLFAMQQVHCQAAQERHILWPLAHPQMTRIFAKDHIQSPVNFIFNPPMRPYCVPKRLRVAVQTHDVLAGFHGYWFARFLPLRAHHPNRPQRRPATRRIQRLQHLRIRQRPVRAPLQRP